jgi:hypothetical protein
MKLIKLTLAEKDKCIMRIESQIQAKKQMLMEKQKTINKNIKFNKLLEYIRNDYQKYYDYIIQQKREQIQAMKILNEYIRELTNSGTLSENNLKDAKYEEKKILNEIKNIEYNMNHLLKQLHKSKNNLNQLNEYEYQDKYISDYEDEDNDNEDNDNQEKIVSENV